MPDVSVVIPVRDAATTLPRTLAALAAQTLGRDRFEVLVADDGSADATAALAEGSEVVREVVRLAVPGGPGAARNAGAVAARAPVLAFTDADCVPAPDWLERGLAATASADLVQGRVEPERPPGPHDRTVWVTGLHGLFETANLLVARAAFERVGGFEPGWTPLGGKELGEDTWLGWRLRRSGARVVYAGDAVVRHAVFERGPLAHAAERTRLVAFPALVSRIPELREELCWRRRFLTRRGAAFDAAALAVLTAAATRRGAPLALALPYIAEVRRDPAPGKVLADAVGAAALLAGSARSRALLL